MPRPKLSADFLVVGLLLVLLITAFLARSPYAVTVPLRDSGIFLSIGSDVLHGKILYQQTWDNKQPLLYLINALGLWMSGGSVWGVWGLELALFILVIYAVYAFIHSTLTPVTTFIVIAISFLAVFPFMGGNYSEEYSIVFQIGILAMLFSVYLPNKKRISRPIASLFIGLLIGLVYCVKQTYLDIPVAFLVFILFLAWIEKDNHVLQNILLLGLGFFLVNLPVFLYFQAHNALHDYIVDAYLFNFSYAGLTTGERVDSILDKLVFISSHPFFFLASSLWLGAVGIWLVKARTTILRFIDHPYLRRLTLVLALFCIGLFIFAQVRGGYSKIGYLQARVLAGAVVFGAISLVLFLRRRPGYPLKQYVESLRLHCMELEWRKPGASTLLLLGAIDFPLAIFSISLSGKPWTHYYITLFPALILLFAGSLAYMSQFLKIRLGTRLVTGILLAVLITGSIPPINQIISSLRTPTGDDERSATAAYLKSVTTPSDTILVWGWESVIYFLAEREAPTRFALPFAFYLDTPYLNEYAEILLNEVKANPPAYIADLRDPNMPLIEGRPDDTCVSGNRLGNQKMVDFLAYVCANYEPDRNFQMINIYKLRQSP